MPFFFVMSFILWAIFNEVICRTIFKASQYIIFRRVRSLNSREWKIVDIYLSWSFSSFSIFKRDHKKLGTKYRPHHSFLRMSRVLPTSWPWETCFWLLKVALHHLLHSEFMSEKFSKEIVKGRVAFSNLKLLLWLLPLVPIYPLEGI